MQALIEWLVTTELSRFVVMNRWVWPIAEALHFMGLVLLVGTVGTFDLRVLGIGKGIAPGAIHRLVPFGILGFGILFCTGVLFIFGTPDQYFYNSAFHLKVIFLLLMGINITFFYSRPFRAVKTLGPYENAPGIAKISVTLSLLIMVGVMCCGRLLTFFRPPAGF